MKTIEKFWRLWYPSIFFFFFFFFFKKNYDIFKVKFSCWRWHLRKKSYLIVRCDNFHVNFIYLVGFALAIWESVKPGFFFEGNAILTFWSCQCFSHPLVLGFQLSTTPDLSSNFCICQRNKCPQSAACQHLPFSVTICQHLFQAFLFWFLDFC